MDTFEREAEQNGFNHVAGIDEAGRGPLAGPVVASAVLFRGLPLDSGIKDSKKLSPARRATLAEKIFSLSAGVAVGIVWPEEIDEINIHAASLLAMERAAAALEPAPDFLLIDGIHRINSTTPQQTVKSGDSLCLSIAAASIIAKTTRDRLMAAYHELYPDYDFSTHKGYPTKDHREAIMRVGPSPIHRRTFRGVRKD